MELTPYGRRPPPPRVRRLRVEAEDCVRASDWAGLLQLRERLRADGEWWASMWAPAVAIALHRTGEGDGWAVLAEAVDRGFGQPEIFGELLPETFADDERWPALAARMAAPPPPAPVELLDWPEPEPGVPLELECQPGGREAELVARVPAARAGAWQTALTLLDWVQHRWTHANDHVAYADALEVLVRVEAGARFACVEYAIVLTQGLNARGIPARRISLLQADHHVGLGRCHEVSEAWIDDLGAWVLLDGQNGAWWTDEDDRPLGVLALRQRYEDGTGARMRTADGPLPAADSDFWFAHFASSSSAAITGVSAGWSPVFQHRHVLPTRRLVRDPGLLEPDLSRLSTGIVDRDGPALMFTPVHPYATGVVVTDATGPLALVGDPATLPVPDMRGEHRLEVATTTRYGTLRGWPLALTVRKPPPPAREDD